MHPEDGDRDTGEADLELVGGEGPPALAGPGAVPALTRCDRGRSSMRPRLVAVLVTLTLVGCAGTAAAVRAPAEPSSFHARIGAG